MLLISIIVPCVNLYSLTKVNAQHTSQVLLDWYKKHNNHNWHGISTRRFCRPAEWLYLPCARLLEARRSVSCFVHGELDARCLTLVNCTWEECSGHLWTHNGYVNSRNLLHHCLTSPLLFSTQLPQPNHVQNKELAGAVRGMSIWQELVCAAWRLTPSRHSVCSGDWMGMYR